MSRALCIAAAGLALAAAGRAQGLQRLTLEEAEKIALQNHPRIRAASFTAQAARQVKTQIRSTMFPRLLGNITGAGAPENSRVAAGGLNNPIVFNRLASGFTVSQLITDFGRTSNLAASADLRASAEEQTASAARADVLLQVHRAYYGALRARALLRIAEQTVAARQLVADQVAALAQSKLKSGLDVSFANVNLAEAKLLLSGAQNGLEAAYANLLSALGYSDERSFEVADEQAMPPLPEGVQALIRQALRERPELASLRLNHSAALRFASAEKNLWLPTVAAQSSFGLVPGRDDRLSGRYAALGFNISVPVFNGHLFAARRAEAEFRAEAADERVRELETSIARDVRVAWLEANDAQQRVELTTQLLEQASQALDLAQARYDMGLSSIVELSQAQLNKTLAEIASATARYDYQIRRDALDYQIGALR